MGGPAIGFEVTLRLIENAVKEHGPFDGFMGFSQGACLVGLLAAMAQKGCESNHSFCNIYWYISVDKKHPKLVLRQFRMMITNNLTFNMFQIYHMNSNLQYLHPVSNQAVWCTKDFMMKSLPYHHYMSMGRVTQSFRKK